MLVARFGLIFTFITAVLASSNTAPTTLSNLTALTNFAVPTKSSGQIMRTKRRSKVGLIIGCTIAGIFFIVLLSVIAVAHERQLKREAMTKDGGEGQVVPVKSEDGNVNPEQAVNQQRTENDGHSGSTSAV